jgi:uncharacterized protein (DUF488 family)
METGEFLEGIQELLEIAGAEVAAIMCAEAVYWKCHRSMIADFLKSNGVDVVHIIDETHSKGHDFTPCARIVSGRFTYHDQLRLS